MSTQSGQDDEPRPSQPLEEQPLVTIEENAGQTTSKAKGEDGYDEVDMSGSSREKWRAGTILFANLIPVVFDHLAYFPVLWELFRTERYGLFGIGFAIDALPGEQSIIL